MFFEIKNIMQIIKILLKKITFNDFFNLKKLFNISK